LAPEQDELTGTWGVFAYVHSKNVEKCSFFAVINTGHISVVVLRLETFDPGLSLMLEPCGFDLGNVFSAYV